MKLLVVGSRDGSEREEGKCAPCGHPDGANSEDRLTAEPVDVEDCWDSREEHGDADDASSEERGSVD